MAQRKSKRSKRWERERQAEQDQWGAIPMASEKQQAKAKDKAKLRKQQNLTNNREQKLGRNDPSTNKPRSGGHHRRGSRGKLLG